MAVTRKPTAKKPRAPRVRREGLRARKRIRKSPAKFVFVLLGVVAAVVVFAFSVNAFSSRGTASTGGTASGGFLSGIFGGGGAAAASSGGGDGETGGFFSRLFGGGSGGAATASSGGGDSDGAAAASSGGGGFFSRLFGGGSGGTAAASSGGGGSGGAATASSGGDGETGGAATASSGGGGFFSRLFGGGSSGTATASSGGGGKAAPFFNTFDSGTYHMKAKSTVEGMGSEVVMEQYVKGGMTATVMEMEGMSARMVMRDNKIYSILDAQRMIVISPVESADPSQRAIQTQGFTRTGSGTARFNGKNLPYEEYSDGKGNKLQFFLDGSKLAGVRGTFSGYTVDTVILALDQNVPSNVFNIPDGYTVIQM